MRRGDAVEGGSIDRDRASLTPGIFALLLGGYAIGHAALRVWVSPVLNIDDAREAVFSQTLAWAYQPRQPPLYTWLTWAIVRVAGPSVAMILVRRLCVLMGERGPSRLAGQPAHRVRATAGADAGEGPKLAQARGTAAGAVHARAPTRRR